MDLNRLFFKALFVGTGVIGGYFAIATGLEAWNWICLDGQIPAKVTRWEVEETGSRYLIWADYDYVVEGRRFSGRTRLSGAPLISEGAALSRIRERSRDGWVAFYATSKPSFSSLEKLFPKGNFIKSIISFCVLIYFYVLKKKLMSI